MMGKSCRPPERVAGVKAKSEDRAVWDLFFSGLAPPRCEKKKKRQSRRRRLVSLEGRGSSLLPPLLCGWPPLCIAGVEEEEDRKWGNHRLRFVAETER